MLKLLEKSTASKTKSVFPHPSSVIAYKSNNFLNSAIVSSGLVTLWPTVRGSSKIS
jgi:hypothetical protein